MLNSAHRCTILDRGPRAPWSQSQSGATLLKEKQKPSYCRRDCGSQRNQVVSGCYPEKVLLALKENYSLKNAHSKNVCVPFYTQNSESCIKFNPIQTFAGSLLENKTWHVWNMKSLAMMSRGHGTVEGNCTSIWRPCPPFTLVGEYHCQLRPIRQN